MNITQYRNVYIDCHDGSALMYYRDRADGRAFRELAYSADNERTVLDNVSESLVQGYVNTALDYSMGAVEGVS